MNSRQRYYEPCRGNFTSLLSGEQLDKFRNNLHRKAVGGCYIYAIGMPLPVQPSSFEYVLKYIDKLELKDSSHD
jgi:hypothetical protein